MYAPLKSTTVSHFAFTDFNKFCVPAISLFLEEFVLLVLDFILLAYTSARNNLESNIVIYLISI